MIQEATAIKGGAMVATGGMMAELIIFNDPIYSILALVGAVVSASGVIHELSNTEKQVTRMKVVAEILKGVILGLLAIPFWFLSLTTVGGEIVARVFDIQSATKLSSSVWLMVSFALAWYTVPIYDWAVRIVTLKAKDKEDNHDA
jgi:hypothetical protein